LVHDDPAINNHGNAPGAPSVRRNSLRINCQSEQGDVDAGCLASAGR
jgi:hypothetical protein